jgi:tRNA (mo5U34)-methyltransferase
MTINDIFLDPSIRWHQRFDVDGVTSPGYHDMNVLMSSAQMPDNLSGVTVIDIGTTNGATAFECERRGAKEVVAVDLCGPDIFGFEKLARHLGSQVEFLQASVYELPGKLQGKTFDYCIFWGVLYHLRHPLLGLDALAQITNQSLTVETVISSADDVSATFFRGTELSNDGSNWWAPSENCLAEMLRSSGFEPTLMKRWDAVISERAIMNCTKVGNLPEYLAEGYDSEILSVEFSNRRSNRVV